MSIQYSIVVPVYNEEAAVYTTYRRLKQIMERTGETYELLFVNDGSEDNTASLLHSYSVWDKTVKLINFSSSFGHQIAITAGTDYASGEALIIIDSSRQDPLELIPELIVKWKEGFDIIYTKPIAQPRELCFMKQAIHISSCLLRTSKDLFLPVYSNDFCLMDRRVYEENRQISAKNQWFRRMVSGLGYRQTVIEYEPGERKASRSAPLKKMLKLCLDVMTSFSLKPLKLAAFTGGALTFAGILYLFIVAYYKLFMDMDISMWHWLIMLQMLTTGFILMIISILGLYIGRIHAETRGSGHAEYRIQDCIGIALSENKIGGVNG